MTNILMYALAVLIWGSTWFAIEFQLGTVAVEVSLAYRYLAAAVLLFGWCLATKRRLRFDAASHRYFALLGLFLFGLNYVLAYYAQVHITSALAAIAFSTILWMNIVNSRLILGTRIEPATYGGAVLGIVGIVVLFWPAVQSLSLTDETLIGACLVVASAAVASIGNIISQRAQQRGLPVVQANAWGMLYGGILLTAAAVLEGRPFTFDFSTGYVVSLAYLTVFGSIVAFGAYLTVLGRIGAHRAGYVFVMFPIVAVLISAMFEGLQIDWHIVVGAGIALAGNLVILAQRHRKAAMVTGNTAGGPLSATAMSRRSTA
jgi:drug/metabolite transporter (DMT)-like permease